MLRLSLEHESNELPCKLKFESSIQDDSKFFVITEHGEIIMWWFSYNTMKWIPTDYSAYAHFNANLHFIICVQYKYQ